MAELNLEIGNLVVRFGKEEVLIDYLDEIVVPAFFNEYTRTYGDTHYFFHSVQWGILNEHNRVTPIIMGRLVKDTILRRNQVYEDGKLKPDRHEIPSAPSSIFAVILDGHRVLYVREESNSPDLNVFRSTLQHFMKRARTETITNHYRETRDIEEPPTKSSLFGSYPVPDVRLTPVASEDSLAEFVGRFSKLREVIMYIQPTNQEPDNHGFFEKIRNDKQRLGASRAKLTYSHTDGLDRNAATEELAAALEGNLDIKMRGFDTEGRKLVGNNHAFGLKEPIEEDARDVPTVTNVLIERFKQLVRDEVIQRGPVAEQVPEKLRNIVRHIRNRLNL